jgi:hypothetical protein
MQNVHEFNALGEDMPVCVSVGLSVCLPPCQRVSSPKRLNVRNTMKFFIVGLHYHFPADVIFSHITQ